MHDLSIVVVSYNNAEWLEPCLRTVFDHAGSIDLDVVVVDSSSTDDTVAVVRDNFPSVRVVQCANHGFAHGNNRGLMTCDARYLLFLNPDTEIVDGTLEGLVDLLDRRLDVGAVGVKQLLGDGSLYPTIRRYPTPLRQLAEAAGLDRLGLGERVTDTAPYERETPCDWATGAFMLVRREALESAGWWDERFFLGSEETDLWKRIRDAGWTTLHLPQMTIVHHAGKGGTNAKVEAQYAYSRLLYARKHMSFPARLAFRLTLMTRFGVRAVFAGGGELARARRAAGRRCLRVLVGAETAPYEAPPACVVRPRAESPVTEPERSGQLA